MILTYFLIAPVRLPFGAQFDREISLFKMRGMLERFARTLHITLGMSDAFVGQIQVFYHHVDHFGFKQKRRKSPKTRTDFLLRFLSSTTGIPMILRTPRN